ncbi:MAG: NADH-quinone oxidoreductase subunit N, partial [Rhodobacteraceae bacterium]|nr:NADH-quinone oxidoreductase subunit N [Paracoccaceae bacterium]
GVPPMLGFFAKLGVWQAAVSADLFGLVVASAISSAIGAYYYLRIVYLMYFGEETDTLDTRNDALLLHGVLMASAAAMVLGVINLLGVDTAASAAAAALVN